MKRIFDPFFTTKETGRGTGLGLSVVHGIVTRLAGALNVESNPGSGTTFDVYIPRHEGEIPAGIQKEIQEVQGTESILLVDDEPGLVTLEKRMLEKQGYRVDGYADPRQALDAFRSTPDDYDVLVTDLTMPELTGLELIEKIREIRKDISVVLVSGFSDDLTQEAAAERGILSFVRKPILADDLSRSVRFAINNPVTPG